MVTCEKEKAEDHDAGVSEVEEGGGRSLYFKLETQQVWRFVPTVQSSVPDPKVLMTDPDTQIENQEFRNWIRILETKLFQILADPDPEHWCKAPFCFSCFTLVEA